MYAPELMVEPLVGTELDEANINDWFVLQHTIGSSVCVCVVDGRIRKLGFTAKTPMGVW
jgi:hypothetical protein